MNKHQLDEIDINFQLNDDCFINKLIKEKKHPLLIGLEKEQKRFSTF